MKNTIGHNRWEISRTESPGNHRINLSIQKIGSRGGERGRDGPLKNELN
jgi:hypothetical protein